LQNSLLAALFTLLGWAAGVEKLKSVLPGLPAMSLNAAFCFIALSAGLLAIPARLKEGSSYRTGLATAFAAATLLAGTLTLFEYIAGI